MAHHSLSFPWHGPQSLRLRRFGQSLSIADREMPFIFSVHAIEAYFAIVQHSDQLVLRRPSGTGVGAAIDACKNT
jgi:hypothetical protein